MGSRLGIGSSLQAASHSYHSHLDHTIELMGDEGKGTSNGTGLNVVHPTSFFPRLK